MGTPASEINDGCSHGELENFGLTVTNIVATVDLKREFDLMELATSMPETEYDPEVSPFVLFRGGSATVMIPRTGKLSVVGASTVQEIDTTLSILAERFNDIGIQINILEPQIQNIVINGKLEQDVVLEAAVLELGMERTEYEPEQFPGVIYRIQENITILLFQSGKFVITGVTNYNEALVASKKFINNVNGL